MTKWKDKADRRKYFAIESRPLGLLFLMYILLHICMEEPLSVSLLALLSLIALTVYCLIHSRWYLPAALILLLIVFPPPVVKELPQGEVKIIVDIVKVADKYLEGKTEKGIGIRIYEEVDLAVGDKAELELNLSLPRQATNPGEFCFRSFLQGRGIFLIGNKVRILSLEKNHFKTTVAGLRNELRNRLHQGFSDLSNSTKSLLLAIFWGDKSNIEPSVAEDYRQTGLAHLLVVSGMHLGIMIKMFSTLGNSLRISEKWQTALTLLFIWFYVFLLEDSFSLLRAAGMQTAVLLSQAYNKKIPKMEALALSGIVILIQSPFAWRDLGLQLSFVSTAALIVFSKRLWRGKQQFNPFIQALASITAVQLVILPLLINAFNYFSLLAWPANLLLLPWLGPILLCAALHYLPLFKIFTQPVLEFLLGVQISLVEFLSGVEAFILPMRSWPLWLILCYYLLLYVIFYTDYSNLKRVSIGVFLLLFLMNSAVLEPKLIMLDVGRAEAIYIDLGFKGGWQIILIDGGNKNPYINHGKSIVKPFLLSRGRKIIDHVFISHSDMDHIGGLATVFEDFAVRHLYLSPQAQRASTSSDCLQEILGLAAEKGTIIHILGRGDELRLAKNCYIEVLHPHKADKAADGNNTSLVFRMDLAGKKILFTGDIEAEGEAEILSGLGQNYLQADILKTPHHGSKTSSTENFLQAVNPVLAIVSCGRDLFQQSPAEEVVLRYNKEKIVLWRTDQKGALTVYPGRRIKVVPYLKEEK